MPTTPSRPLRVGLVGAGRIGTSHARVIAERVPGAVFGSAGIITVGDGARSTALVSTSAGRHADIARGDVELMIDAYTGEFVEFVAAVREGRQPSVTGHDARRALAVALACIDSCEQHAPVAITEAHA